MSIGTGAGENRIQQAIEAAMSSPLLDVEIRGAKRILLNITSNENIKLTEIAEAANTIEAIVDPDANIIWGSAFNENLNGKIRVSVVATGIDNEGIAASPATQSRTPFPVSRPAPEPVAAAPAPIPPLFESTNSAPVEEPNGIVEPEDDDSLVLGSDFEALEADEDATADGQEQSPESSSFSSASWAGADALELNTPADANEPSPAPVDVTQAPERAAPRISTGGTLFERMSNLSRGLSRSDDDDDKGQDGASSNGVPRFLDRQNNS
jgi:cell division protein FtsZ